MIYYRDARKSVRIAFRSTTPRSDQRSCNIALVRCSVQAHRGLDHKIDFVRISRNAIRLNLPFYQYNAIVRRYDIIEQFSYFNLIKINI